MDAPTITLACEPTALTTVVEALAVELLERRLEPVQTAIHAAKALEQPARVEVRHLAAGGAGECLLLLHASDELLGFLAAVRAGKFDVLTVEERIHE